MRIALAVGSDSVHDGWRKTTVYAAEGAHKGRTFEQAVEQVKQRMLRLQEGEFEPEELEDENFDEDFYDFLPDWWCILEAEGPDVGTMVVRHSRNRKPLHQHQLPTDFNEIYASGYYLSSDAGTLHFQDT